MNSVKKLSRSVILISFIGLSFFFTGLVFSAPNNQVVKATVKIGICGDGVIEKGEDCEIGQSTNKRCEDFGLTGGLLRCDRSCHFDVLNCDDVLNINKVYESLPEILQVWDLNRDGKLTQEEFKTSIVKWVQSWRTFLSQPTELSSSEIKSCDLNDDKKCDVVDLSILMYYSRYD
ncbi:hypothetical protein M0R04_01030 [Candidatus Dojkabacteria bacterium]|jgi:hypothetical protein|nr:hypothetical protein [Candidatus Dojkabacteria bacterium]